MSFESELLQQIKEHEGLKLFPYKCPAGKLTIGYGHNLQDNGLTKTACEFILYDDIDEAKRNLRSIFGGEFFENLPKNKKIALIDMMFNLGMVKFLTFKRFIFAVETQNWDNASYEIIHSRAYEQNKKRYKKLSEQIKS